MHLVLAGVEPEVITDLHELGHTLTVLYGGSTGPIPDYCAHAISASCYVEALTRTELIWSALIHLGVDNAVDTIIPAHELAVVPAAMLNQILGLKTPNSPAAALACRDKALQKMLWHQHGVTTAKFVVLPGRPASAAALAEALNDLSEPFVIKPPAEGGSRMVYSCANAEEVFQTITSVPELSRSVVEEKQSGPEWHFDGTLIDGEISSVMVSRYLTPLIEAHSGLPLRSVAFPPGRNIELYVEAKEIAQRGASALGAANGAFHLEVFGGPGAFVCGEFALRPPGVIASLSAQYTIGISLWAAHGRILAGDPPPTARPVNGGVYGFACLPRMAGMPNRVSEDDIWSMAGVRHIQMRVRPGEVMKEIRASTASIAWVLIEAPDVETCEARINEAVERTAELHRCRSEENG